MNTIDEYLDRRSRLGKEASRFRCPDSCPRYGCKDPELHVPVTVMDLLLQSMVLKAKPGEIYNRFYKIGWSPEADVPWVGRFTLELQKPCGFLKENWCEIYPARPIGCAQFPEAWYLLPSENPGTPNRGRFQDYPCLKSPSPITTRREKHLAKLSEMAAQERWISDFYLFGFSPFCVDLRNLVEDLLKTAQREGLEPDGIDPDTQHVIPYTLIEWLFQRKLSEAGITVQIQERVENLDLPQEKVPFFELRAVSDEIRESFGFDEALIYHRFEKSGLRRYSAVRRRPSHKEKTKVSIQEKDNGHTRKEKRA